MKAFELAACLHFYEKAQERGQKTVLASLVGLHGSSYRQPGVRMLIAQDGAMSGAVSGGCVEKEVIASAQSVFESGHAKVISYDGQYRLGCEGLLHILIEPFELHTKCLQKLQTHLETRKPIKITSHYEEHRHQEGAFYSEITLASSQATIKINTIYSEQSSAVFSQTVITDPQLLIFGSEHDAEKLCAQAALLGWDVHVIISPKSSKNHTQFPNARSIIATTPESFATKMIDQYTFAVLMTHNYALDLQFLRVLKDKRLEYIGILGSRKRKANLEFALLEQEPELEDHFLESLHSPAGLDIGAITPQEIALAICAEILHISNDKKSKPQTTLDQSVSNSINKGTLL